MGPFGADMRPRHRRGLALTTSPTRCIRAPPETQLGRASAIVAEVRPGMATQVDSRAPGCTGVPPPAWIAPSLEVKEGRDPLGLQTTTQDRLMPLLLPGILELTRRARYFSFYAFLLAEYRDRRLAPDPRSLSEFIKRREWELGLAVLRCPRGCGSSPVGARRLGAQVRSLGPFPRGESVESPFGGYGLYYRTPLADLGIVAKAGTMLGDQPIPVDVLYDTDRARRLAQTFRAAVEHTAYYQRAMLTSGDLAAETIDEYADAACLCRLRDRPDERAAVHDAMFGEDPPGAAAAADGNRETAGSADRLLAGGAAHAGVVQRRRSVGHYLTLLAADPEVVLSESAYRERLWSPPTSRNDAHALIAGQWAALAAKDVWQEAICSVWSGFCRAGLARTRDLGRGLTWDETRAVASGLIGGPPAMIGGQPTRSFAAQLAAGTLTISDAAGDSVNVASTPLEQLRELTKQLDTATSGLIVSLELARRMQGRSGVGWDQAAALGSGWQPSVAAIAAGLQAHLARNPVIADTLWWLVSQFILPVHERIAYSKLPEFTFRFRWEDGLLRFYDLGMSRFPLAAIRWDPLASLTWDLGLWDETNRADLPAALTDCGAAFTDEALT